MSLTLLPAIDLRRGKCVRLMHGDPDAETVYGDDPLAQASAFREAGSTWLHVVDLDGAFTGAQPNRDAIANLIAHGGLKVEVGGGLRTLEAIGGMVELGAARAIVGTAALKEPDMLSEACAAFPGRVWVGIDARGGKVAIKGWLEDTDKDAVDFAKEVEQRGAAGIVYTDILRDGAQSGNNVAETRRVAQAVGIEVVASGGIGSLKDLEALRPAEVDGVSGVISGRALYEGTLDLAAGLALLASA